MTDGYRMSCAPTPTRGPVELLSTWTWFLMLVEPTFGIRCQSSQAPGWAIAMPWSLSFGPSWQAIPNPESN
jgi:hypothetical protein